jgi:Rrf2 family protein
MKLITRDTDYAIRALCYIAKHKKELISVAQLTHELKVPQPFLRKILQLLNKKNLLCSYKGKGGGFRLAIEPSKILLLDLMQIFQGKFSLNVCLLKKVSCPNIKTCMLKKKIDGIEKYVVFHLRGITLKSIIK